MTDSPFFSIVIPVYNGGDPFVRCLKAIHSSTFTDWELIVVDDGSTDGSEQVARQFGATLLRTDPTQGTDADTHRRTAAGLASNPAPATDPFPPARPTIRENSRPHTFQISPPGPPKGGARREIPPGGGLGGPLVAPSSNRLSDSKGVDSGLPANRSDKANGQQGPAAARNIGARMARGRYLFFTDADCELHPEALAQLAQILNDDPGLEAAFGSYDDEPGAPGFMAQYKNLFHHYIHQSSSQEASTFWTACGAIKRPIFLALGGFDLQRFRQPSVEDIDLGYRLKQAGGRIRLARQVRVKHLKAWSLVSLLKSDILARGIPWTRLILRDRAFTCDLNLQTHNRISVVAIYGLLFSITAAFFQPGALFIALGLGLLLLRLNWNLYTFFNRKRGLWFTLKVIPMHWLYYGYNAVSFACGLLLYWREQLLSGVVPPPRPLVTGVESDEN